MNNIPLTFVFQESERFDVIGPLIRSAVTLRGILIGSVAQYVSISNYECQNLTFFFLNILDSLT